MLVWILFIGFSFVLPGCGGGGDGDSGGGGGGGGGNGNPPATAPAIANLGGDWDITERGVSNCPGEETYSLGPYRVSVNQNGNALTVTANVGTFTGTISGDQVSWTGSYSEDGGTTTITSMTLTVAADGNSLSGSSRWSWTDGAIRCSGTTQAINGTRASNGATAPSAPTQVSATQRSWSAINLSWTPGTGSTTGFKVERGRNSVFAQVAVVAPNTTSYLDEGLEASTTYYYRVRAFDGALDSVYSEVASATTDPAPAEVPAAPSDLMVEGSDTSSVTLRWVDNSSNATTNEVERSSSSSSGFAAVASIPRGTSTYRDTNLASATTYYYRVRAATSTARSAYSNVVSASTRAVVTAPVAPGNLVATAVSGSRVALKWNDNAQDETGYKIERSLSETSGYSQIGIAEANATTFTDSRTSPATQYYYRVRATRADVDPPLDSSYSNVAGLRTPLPPPILTAPSTTANGTFEISWTFQWPGLVSTGDGYELQESTSSPTDGFTRIFDTIGTNDHASPKSITLTRTAGTYHYRARAILHTGSGEWSNVATVQVTAQSARILRIVNDLASQPAGQNDWATMNQIIRVRIGTSESAVLNNTQLEKLWPYDSASANSIDHFSYVINPAFNQTTSFRDFALDGSIPVGATYHVYMQTGWWEFFSDPFSGFMSWEKHMTSVVGCRSNDTVYKWATFWVSGHQSGLMTVRASQFLPIGNFYGSSFCP